jgi:ring-1,2-phenylacetyl-CoA epoxidase subunit PaaE
VVKAMSTLFHSLRIRDVRRETKDCVSIAFDVPSELRDAFAFSAGQYVNLRAFIDGDELRRSYSLCNAPHSGEWRVAIKRVEGGCFSEYANTKLKTGDAIDVMPPDGKFCFAPSRDEKRHVVAIAAGSGITPILSIVTTLLEREPQSSVTLIYGNRRVRDIVFKEELEDLRDRFLARFQLFHVLSQEPVDSPILHGRIDEKKIVSIIDKIRSNAQDIRAYVCGPGDLIDVAQRALHECGLSRDRVYREVFTPSQTTAARASKPTAAPRKSETVPSAAVTVIADGIERVLRVPFNGDSVLETALAAGIDAPYACKAGVCCTCRAQVLEGEVKMDANYTLEDHEVRRGFVLTCQSHPVTATVKLSYDAR